MNFSSADAIIFDLGGVILNLDYQKTIDAFVELGLLNFEEEYTQLEQQKLFDDYETGKISSFHFVNRLLDKLPKGRNANQVVHAWNAMILDFPKERLNYLLELKKSKRIFLLSNTNDLHLELVQRKLKEVYPSKQLSDFFEKVYYSCDLGLRKPNPEIFTYVCQENSLDPSKTLFIDDSIQHVEGAKKAGIHAVHLTTSLEEFIVKN
jgi:glucose-1-phosphatase